MDEQVASRESDRIHLHRVNCLGSDRNLAARVPRKVLGNAVYEFRNYRVVYDRLPLLNLDCRLPSQSLLPLKRSYVEGAHSDAAVTDLSDIFLGILGLSLGVIARSERPC